MRIILSVHGTFFGGWKQGFLKYGMIWNNKIYNCGKITILTQKAPRIVAVKVIICIK